VQILREFRDEIRDIRQNMASKEDLNKMASKEDLNKMASKEDLRLVTKELKKLAENTASKGDLGLVI